VCVAKYNLAIVSFETCTYHKVIAQYPVPLGKMSEIVSSVIEPAQPIERTDP
jgi:hypothetical protein